MSSVHISSDGTVNLFQRDIGGWEYTDDRLPVTVLPNTAAH